jgi:septum formation protein
LHNLAELLPNLTLASQSVARKALLQSLGIEVTTYATHCDESHQESDPAKAVALLSERKLQAFLSVHPNASEPVLCCDTLIAFEGVLIGKPIDQEEARAQLSSFSGKAQEVHSGWALWYEGRQYGGSDKALVWFKHLDDDDIEGYLQTDEWKGAAGSYRIQGEGRALIDHIEGDEATVIGLPLLQISEILVSPLSE